MNKLKKIAAILLAFVLLLSLTACGKKNPLSGTWEGELDMSQDLIGPVDTAMSAMSAVLPGVELPKLEDFVSEFTVPYRICFNEDGTYLSQVDQEQFQSCIDQLKAGIVDYYRELFASLLIGVVADMGLDQEISSVEELEEFMEVSLDEAISEVMGMDMETFVDSLIDGALEGSGYEDQMSSMGKYEIKDDKLFMSQGSDGQIFPELYDLYSLDGNVLTITAGPAAISSQYSRYYPLVLEKAA